jgi:hypothetical protein
MYQLCVSITNTAIIAGTSHPDACKSSRMSPLSQFIVNSPEGATLQCLHHVHDCWATSLPLRSVSVGTLRSVAMR